MGQKYLQCKYFCPEHFLHFLLAGHALIEHGFTRHLGTLTIQSAHRANHRRFLSVIRNGPSPNTSTDLNSTAWLDYVIVQTSQRFEWSDSAVSDADLNTRTINDSDNDPPVVPNNTLASPPRDEAAEQEKPKYECIPSSLRSPLQNVDLTGVDYGYNVTYEPETSLEEIPPTFEEISREMPALPVLRPMSIFPERDNRFQGFSPPLRDILNISEVMELDLGANLDDNLGIRQNTEAVDFNIPSSMECSPELYENSDMIRITTEERLNVRRVSRDDRVSVRRRNAEVRSELSSIPEVEESEKTCNSKRKRLEAGLSNSEAEMEEMLVETNKLRLHNNKKPDPKKRK